MPVPYVPTLGPVRQEDPPPDLFEAAVDIAGTGRFLPYDKDRRWSSTRTEHVLMQAGTVGPVFTVLHDGRVAGAIGPMETLSLRRSARLADEPSRPSCRTAVRTAPWHGCRHYRS